MVSINAFAMFFLAIAPLLTLGAPIPVHKREEIADVTVECNDKDFDGLVAVGCTPINVALDD